MNLSDILNWLKGIQEERKIDQARQDTEKVAEGFWEVYHMATTYHGRYKLFKVLAAADQGEIELDSKVQMMISVALRSANYQVYATLN